MKVYSYKLPATKNVFQQFVDYFWVPVLIGMVLFAPHQVWKSYRAHNPKN